MRYRRRRRRRRRSRGRRRSTRLGPRMYASRCGRRM